MTMKRLEILKKSQYFNTLRPATWSNEHVNDAQQAFFGRELSSFKPKVIFYSFRVRKLKISLIKTKYPQVIFQQKMNCFWTV